MIGIRTVEPIKPSDLELDLHVKPFVAFDRRADPPSVRGWPLSAVIDGIVFALGAHVFPGLNPELHERFDETFALHVEEDPAETGSPASPS